VAPNKRQGQVHRLNFHTWFCTGYAHTQFPTICYKKAVIKWMGHLSNLGKDLFIFLSGMNPSLLVPNVFKCSNIKKNFLFSLIFTFKYLYIPILVNLIHFVFKSQKQWNCRQTRFQFPIWKQIFDVPFMWTANLAGGSLRDPFASPSIPTRDPI